MEYEMRVAYTQDKLITGRMLFLLFVCTIPNVYAYNLPNRDDHLI